MSRIKSEVELLKSFIGEVDNKEEINMHTHHEEVLNQAIKGAADWSEVFGRRIKGRYEKHWVKVMKVQERATLVLEESNEMKLGDTIKYFIERGERLEELYLLKKYYDFVTELKTRKAYDYQVVSKYSFELGKKLERYI